MKPPLAIVRIAVIGAALAASLAACGTKTQLTLPPGPAKPPLLGGPIAAQPAKPAPAPHSDDNATAGPR